MSRYKGFLLICLAGMLVGCLALGCAGGGADDGANDGIPYSGPLYSLSVTWDPPAQNEDGSPVEDLEGYKVYFGQEPGRYSRVQDVGNANTATFSGRRVLPHGTG